MNRRKFFKNGCLFTIGAVVMNPLQGSANILDLELANKNKKAKNIILLVSNGMSTEH